MTDESDAHRRPDPSQPIALGGPIASAEDLRAASQADPTPPEPPPAAPAVETATAPAARPQRYILPVLSGVGFVVLAGAIAYLWVRPVPVPQLPSPPPDQSAAVAQLQSDVSAQQKQLAALDQRETADIVALRSAIAAIPAPGAQPTTTPAPGASSSDAGLAPQLAALSDRVNQLAASAAAQAQQSQSLPSAASLADLSARLDAIAQREAKDGDALRQDLTAVQQQLATVSGQTQSLTKDTSGLPQLTATSGRLSQVLRAQEALRAGQPLGSIDSAPPALARFATLAPPTEAALRLAFPAAARAADKAGEPVADRGRFWHRVWLHVQDLVTIRQGDRVLVGDPTSGVLAHAQRLLDAGDLPGAVAVVRTLTGPAASAMAPWVAQAQSLIAAQQALAQMAAG